MTKKTTQSVAKPENDSGDRNYPWRHPVPIGWKKVRLGDVIEIVRGISFPKDAKAHEPRAGYVACLRTTNVQRSVEWDDLWFVPEEHVKRDGQYVRSGDILISTANSNELVGKVAPVTSMPYRATLGAFISLLRPKDDVDCKFAYYQIAWSDTQDRIRSTASTTTNISNVSTKKLSNIELAIPPLNQQKRIVAEIEKQFSRLDEAVANLKRVKANLKRYKAAVLKAAVEGRLVETEAELARREGRSYETGAQLLQRILETRRSQWKGKGKYKEPAAPDTTDLPGLPEGWVWATVDSVCEQIVDCPHSTPRFQSEGLPCIDTTWMTTEGLAIERARYVDDATYKERIARLEPKPGDIVFAREGTIGTAALIPNRMRPCLGQRVMLLRSSKLYLNGLLRHVLHSETVKQQYRVQALGSTVAHINVGDVKAFIVPVPPLAEQHRIVAEVDRRLSLIRETETQIDANLTRADRFRQAILASTFSGKLSRNDTRRNDSRAKNGLG